VVKEYMPSLFLKGIYFICRVTECPEPILPGQSGEISIWAICREEVSHYFSRGVHFELKEGSKKIAAHCEIISDVDVDYYEDNE